MIRRPFKAVRVLRGVRRKVVVLGATIAAFVAAAWFARPRIEFFRLTRHFWPIERIQTLNHPVAVAGWRSDGLLLADGRTVAVPGVAGLPARSAALAEATKRGVEIGNNGRVRALVRVDHRCAATTR